MYLLGKTAILVQLRFRLQDKFRIFPIDSISFVSVAPKIGTESLRVSILRRENSEPLILEYI